MNREQLGLARESLASASDIALDFYRERREELNKSLGGLAMECSAEEAVANANMLKEICRKTISAKGFPSLTLESPADIRAAQSTMLRYSSVASSFGVIVLLGAREQKHTVSVLGYNLYDSNLEQRTVRKRPFKKLHAAMQEKINSPLDENELARIASNGIYRMQADDPGILKIGTIGKSTLDINAISDRTLADYNVFDYVENIALAFDKTVEVDTLLASNLRLQD